MIGVKTSVELCPAHIAAIENDVMDWALDVLKAQAIAKGAPFAGLAAVGLGADLQLWRAVNHK